MKKNIIISLFVTICLASIYCGFDREYKSYIDRETKSYALTYLNDLKHHSKAGSCTLIRKVSTGHYHMEYLDNADWDDTPECVHTYEVVYEDGSPRIIEN